MGKLSTTTSAEEYVEAPRDLKEWLAWTAVEENGVAAECLETLGDFRAKKEPFLALEAAGWRKRKARLEFASGRVVVIHFWESPLGERDHLKIKN
jgi:hypothetical protein